MRLFLATGFAAPVEGAVIIEGTGSDFSWDPITFSGAELNGSYALEFKALDANFSDLDFDLEVQPLHFNLEPDGSILPNEGNLRTVAACSLAGCFGPTPGSFHPAGGQIYPVSYDVTPNSLLLNFRTPEGYTTDPCVVSGTTCRLDMSFYVASLNASFEGPTRYQLSLSPISAIPEPTTWALMIVGFGMAGYALRRRRFSPLKTSVTFA